MEKAPDWIPIREAARFFGYTNAESFRQRLRELRRRGRVVDLGRPPSGYAVGKETGKDNIVLYWPNPTTALMRRNAPKRLLIPRRGRRRLDLAP